MLAAAECSAGRRRSLRCCRLAHERQRLLESWPPCCGTGRLVLMAAGHGPSARLALARALTRSRPRSLRARFAVIVPTHRYPTYGLGAISSRIVLAPGRSSSAPSPRNCTNSPAGLVSARAGLAPPSISGAPNGSRAITWPSSRRCGRLPENAATGPLCLLLDDSSLG